MSELNLSYQNILDGQGFEMAFAGMTIVFVALSMVSIFIALLPRILVVVNQYIPEGHARATPNPKPAAANAEEAAVAAVAYAVHRHSRGQA
jgi:sodium pump decarboxylase gamma subunit